MLLSRYKWQIWLLFGTLFFRTFFKKVRKNSVRSLWKTRFLMQNSLNSKKVLFLTLFLGPNTVHFREITLFFRTFFSSWRKIPVQKLLKKGSWGPIRVLSWKKWKIFNFFAVWGVQDPIFSIFLLFRGSEFVKFSIFFEIRHFCSV